MRIVDLYDFQAAEALIQSEQQLILDDGVNIPVWARLQNGWAAGRPYFLLEITTGQFRGAEIWVEVEDQTHVVYREEDVSDGFLFNYGDGIVKGTDPVEPPGALIDAWHGRRWAVRLA